MLSTNKFSIGLLSFLVFFASFGWVADSGTIFVKFLCYALMLLLCWLIINRRGFVNIGLGAAVGLLAFILLFIASIFVHERSEELNNILKLLLCAVILCSITIDEFYQGICAASNYIFISAIVGWLFAMFGLGVALPDFVAEGIRRTYFITPLGSVYSGGQELRAHGVFWEPGMLALYANLVLVMKTFRYGVPFRNCWMEMLLVLVSRSAGGFLCLIMCLLAVYCSRKRLLDISISLLIFVLVGVFSLNFFDHYDSLVSAIDLVTTSIFDRHLDEDESFGTRSLDMYVPFLSALDSVFVGYRDIGRFYDMSVSIAGFSQTIITNSFGIIVYYYGYLFLTAYLLFLAAGVIGMSFGGGYVIVFAVFAMYIVEPIPFSMVSFLIISNWMSGFFIYKEAKE